MAPFEGFLPIRLASDAEQDATYIRNKVKCQGLCLQSILHGFTFLFIRSTDTVSVFEKFKRIGAFGALLLCIFRLVDNCDTIRRTWTFNSFFTSSRF